MNIPVKDINELYAAIKNPSNKGATLILAAGNYPLSEKIDTVNAGRLELLQDMILQGQPNQPGLVVIDASKLPEASFVPSVGFPNRTGAIRMGLGFNQLESVTVIGSPTEKALSTIDTDLIWNGVSKVRITNCIITGGRIGIDVRNVGKQSDNRDLEVELEDNEVYNNLVSSPGTQQAIGFGIIIQHANGVSDGSITVSMSGNRIHDNIIGMKVFNNSNSASLNTNNNTTHIRSNGDKFEKNKLGIYFQGGTNQDPTTTTNGNFISFDAHGTKIRDNQGILPSSTILPCGIFLTGGTKPDTGNVSSNNRIDMKLTGCPVSGNKNSDIIAFGAFTITKAHVASAPLPQVLPGHDNVVEIKLQGSSKKATIDTTDCYPPEPAHTNKVIIL